MHAHTHTHLFRACQASSVWSLLWSCMRFLGQRSSYEEQIALPWRQDCITVLLKLKIIVASGHCPSWEQIFGHMASIKIDQDGSCGQAYCSRIQNLWRLKFADCSVTKGTSASADVQWKKKKKAFLPQPAIKSFLICVWTPGLSQNPRDIALILCLFQTSWVSNSHTTTVDVLLNRPIKWLPAHLKFFSWSKIVIGHCF